MTDTIDEFICPSHRVMTNPLHALKDISNNIARSIHDYSHRRYYATDDSSVSSTSSTICHFYMNPINYFESMSQMSIKIKRAFGVSLGKLSEF